MAGGPVKEGTGAGAARAMTAAEVGGWIGGGGDL